METKELLKLLKEDIEQQYTLIINNHSEQVGELRKEIYAQLYLANLHKLPPYIMWEFPFICDGVVYYYTKEIEKRELSIYKILGMISSATTYFMENSNASEITPGTELAIKLLLGEVELKSIIHK